jgi:hypothetical protein
MFEKWAYKNEVECDFNLQLYSCLVFTIQQKHVLSAYKIKCMFAYRPTLHVATCFSPGRMRTILS